MFQFGGKYIKIISYRQIDFTYFGGKICVLTNICDVRFTTIGDAFSPQLVNCMLFIHCFFAP